MQLTINGTDNFFPDLLTVEQLLRQLKLSPDQIVIELNQNILCTEDFSQTELKSGDSLEIVHFVGGG